VSTSKIRTMPKSIALRILRKDARSLAAGSSELIVGSFC
jgi:hypothetical protein